MINEATLSAKLLKGCEQLHIELSQDQVTQLINYLALMHKWNKVHNLTAIKQPSAMLTHHILDSLSILSWVRDGHLADIGSGAGLPGIVLAIAKPGLKVTLVDSAAKRTDFLQHVKAQLQLTHVDIIHDRAEAVPAAKHGLTSITWRALGTLSDVVQSTWQLADDDTHWLAMKGKYPQDELIALPPSVEVLEVARLHVPEVEGERHIVVMAKRKQHG
jgi:16S rRNA (guanine527-N7)-methyltransferase